MRSFIGKSPDELSITERRKVAGQWIALELYNPSNLALRRIAAMGDSIDACHQQLLGSGNDPSEYQFELMRKLG